MGIDVQTYRLRIGVHCGRNRLKRKMRITSYCAESKYDPLTDISCRMMICTLFLACMYGYGLIILNLATSSFISGMVSAFRGDVFSTGVFGHAIAEQKCTSLHYHADLAMLLILSGDVEVNPGPGLERKDLDQAIKSLREALMQGMEKRQKHATDSLLVEMKRMNDSVQCMAEKLVEMQNELRDMRKKMECQEDFIQHISNQQAEMNHRLEELEKRTEFQEQRNRRDNVILYNVEDQRDETNEESENKFLEVVNGVLPSQLKDRDVRRVHRIGKPDPGKKRPLLACLARSADKFAILQSRQKLKDKGIGVSSDRTIEQRRRLREAREAGDHAFFKGGEMHVVPGQKDSRDRIQTRSSTMSQPQTQSGDS